MYRNRLVVVVRRYIDILTNNPTNFPYSTCISSFLAAASTSLCSILVQYMETKYWMNTRSYGKQLCEYNYLIISITSFDIEPWSAAARTVPSCSYVTIILIPNERANLRARLCSNYGM